MPGLKRKSLGSGGGDNGRAGSSSAAASSSKKSKPSSDAPTPVPTSSLLDTSQRDFPRGGGSGLSQFEHATTLREVRAEMAKAQRGDDDLFKDGGAASSKKSALSPEDDAKRKEERRKANRERNNAKKKKVAFGKALEDGKGKKKDANKDHIRIEHLNYKVSEHACASLTGLKALNLAVSSLSLHSAWPRAPAFSARL